MNSTMDNGYKLMNFNPENTCMLTTDNSNRQLLRRVNECGIILFNKNLEDVLIVFQKHSDKWGFPKGYMTRLEQYNREYFKCAKRELLEETGIDLRTHRHTKYGTIIIGNKLFYVIEIKRNIVSCLPFDRHEIKMTKWIKRRELYEFVKNNPCNMTLNNLFDNHVKDPQYIYSI